LYFLIKLAKISILLRGNCKTMIISKTVSRFVFKVSNAYAQRNTEKNEISCMILNKYTIIKDSEQSNCLIAKGPAQKHCKKLTL